MSGVVELSAERAKRTVDSARFWKVRLAGERFWVRDPVRHSGMWRAFVENNLIEHPYRAGDVITFGEEQIIHRGLEHE